jgi:hypothetical protein
MKFYLLITFILSLLQPIIPTEHPPSFFTLEVYGYLRLHIQQVINIHIISITEASTYIINIQRQIRIT